MCVAIGVEWVLDKRWRPWVPALVVPASAYLAWYLVIGQAGLSGRDVASTSTLLEILPAIQRGLSNAFGSITGLPLLGLLVAAAAVTWGSGQTLRRELAPRAGAIFVALGVMYAMIGAVRGDLFDGALDYTRYTYVAGILALVALGVLLGRITLPTVGRRRLFILGSVGCWLALALVVNIGLLIAGREVFLGRADMTRALLIAALDVPRAASVDSERSLVLVPSPTSLDRIAQAYGDPRTDAIVPWAIRGIPSQITAEASRRLVEGAPIPTAPIGEIGDVNGGAPAGATAP
jgi:hypothetical protein